MSKGWTMDFLNIIRQPRFRIGMALKLQYVDGDANEIRVHSGFRDLTHNGETYVGVGNFGKIEPIKNSSNRSVSRLRFSDEWIGIEDY